jgi:hypothetical protein
MAGLTFARALEITCELASDNVIDDPDMIEEQEEQEAAIAMIESEAPAMLAALRDLVAGNYGQPSGVTVPALDPARAILARIDGTPSGEAVGAIGDAQAKAARLRADALALDTGMDPALVRELHAEADRIESGGEG